jgi:pentatricopeptide repeat protein
MNPEHKKYILENAGRKSPAEIASELGIRQRSVKKVIMAGRDKGAPERAVAREAAPKAAARPSGKAIVLISAALIMILGFAVYANSLTGKFVYDDNILIAKNLFVKKWPPSPKFFTASIGIFGGIQTPFYRPIQMVSYAVDYRLWKMNVVGYHLVNMLLHVLAALCVYRLIDILFMDRIVSVITAVFFVLHPVHTTVVSYISTRAESLYLLFMLIAFIFYIKSARAKGPLPYIVMLLSYSLSLLSKENAVIFPFLILLYHYAFKERIGIGRFVSVSSLAFIYVLLRLTALQYLLSGIKAGATLFQRIPGFFVALSTYVRLLFLPLGLHIEYGDELFSLADPRALSGMVMLAALIFCIFKTRKTNRLVFFSLSWFLLTLLPVSNLYRLNSYMSENWLYLPSIGAFLAAAGYLAALLRRKNLRVFAAILTVCLASFYSYLTVRQNETWHDPVRFYERTLKYAPRSAKAYNNLGLIYYGSGIQEKAAACYKKAIELMPGLASSYNNLANVYSEMGRLEDAIEMYEKAAEADDKDFFSCYHLGLAYYKRGRLEEAIAMYKKAIQLNPNVPEPYNNLGSVYYNMDKRDESIAAFRKALEVDPDNAEARQNLAILSMDPEEQLLFLKKKTEENPRDVRTYTVLGNAYYQAGRKEDAIAAYEKALEIDPGSADLYNSIGAAYFYLGRRGEAGQAFMKALEIDPGNTRARKNLSLVEEGRRAAGAD